MNKEQNTNFLEQMEVTKIENIFICNNCGATVVHKLKNLKHNPNCQKGESKKWEDYYSVQDSQEKIDKDDLEYEKYISQGDK